MLKLVVLCAFFAAAAAEPSGFLTAAPVTTYSSVVSPGVTTISQESSSVIHPSPLVYSTPVAYPYAHFIKKRSAPLFNYPFIAPYATTYAAPAAPLLTSTYSAPFISSAPLVSHAAIATPAVHLIKKRSAPLLATTYYANGPYATAPFPYSAASVSSYSLASPVYSSAAVIPSAPLPAVHLIKKRSAPLLSTYYSTPYSAAAAVPLAYSTPLVHSAPVISTPIASYAAYPAAYTQLIKK